MADAEANTFTADQAISIVAASTTAFIEGSGTIYLVISVTNVAKALAELATKVNAILTALKNAKLMATA
tara:strand:+ start:150 stop:356 length:207 start_codon:yes stop_codon:yes gene_type:complete